MTGVRHDAYANANRIPVEEDKPAEDRGKYRHPEVYRWVQDGGHRLRRASEITGYGTPIRALSAPALPARGALCITEDSRLAADWAHGDR